MKNGIQIPKESNATTQHEEHEPFFMWRGINFAYNNEKVQIRVEKNRRGKDRFLLILCERIIGYFEPEALPA